MLPLMLAMLAGCVKPMAEKPPWPSPPSGSFLSSSGQPLSDTEITGLAGASDFILIGESHTNPCDHAVQARLIENLAAGGFRFSIGLEMLPVTAQPVLDKFNARSITATDFGREADWEKLWGYPYALYKPIFELAERYNIPVAGLNTPREVLTKFRDEGAARLSDSELAALPRRIIEVSPIQKKALEEQVGLHQMMRAPGSTNATGNPKPPTDMSAMASKFFLVQALWDSMMAEQALVWRERLAAPMVILAGGGHVEHGWGIEYRLHTLDPAVRCLAIMPVRDREDLMEQTAPGQRPFSEGATVFFHCAAQHKSRLGMNILFESATLRVESIDPGSPADTAGLRPGDILLKAGDKILLEASDLHFAAMAASRQKKPLELTVRRGMETLNVNLLLPDARTP